MLALASGVIVVAILTTSVRVASVGEVAEGPPAPATAPTSNAVTGYGPQALYTNCIRCHAIPPPDVLPKHVWPKQIEHMRLMIDQYGLGFPLSQADAQIVANYYYTNAPVELPRLVVPFTPSPVRFQLALFGEAVDTGAPTPPMIGNVNITDLDGNGLPDVIICDIGKNAVTWATRGPDRWYERKLGDVLVPGKTEVADLNGDGHLDVAVAGVGHLLPSDEPAGHVTLLLGDGQGQFQARTIASNLPRVADVQPGDFDRDGDVDFIVAMFGAWKTGQIGLLTNLGNGGYSLQTLFSKSGCSHVPTADLDGDGDLDFVAMLSQEHEMIMTFTNDGQGRFAAQVIWQGPHPMYGLSGIQLVDLDQDRDLDVLFTNGDAMDLYPVPKPYHGVQWLENVGEHKFVYHHLCHFYGAYRAVACDLDGDRDLDIVVTSLVNDWEDNSSVSLMWLENDHAQHFTPHPIGTGPTHLVTAAAGDLNGDGRTDIITGGLYLMPPFRKIGRTMLWLNAGPASPVQPRPTQP